VRQARELLREYLERRQSSAAAGASDALREENLRRLLRHVSAAHHPSEVFEARLRQAMRETGAETTAHRPGRQGARAWSRLGRPAWPVWAPAAALAAGALVFAAQTHRFSHSTETVHLRTVPLPLPQPPSRGRTPAQTPLIGYVLMGELRRQHAGEAHAQAVGSGADIRLEDSVSTDADADASIVFLDSSLCHLLPNSTVRYTAAGHTGLQRPSRVLLTRGETWNRVEKGGPPFAVQTGSATAIVRGTEFDVAVDARGKTTLRVKEGKVELQAARKSVMVPAGMQTAALPGHAPLAPVLMVAARKAPPGAKPQPGTVHVARPAARSAGGSAADGSGRTFRRSSEPAPPPAGASPQSTPTDSSGAPTSSSSEGGAEPHPPVSTSR
jgi:hypothetical protein